MVYAGTWGYVLGPPSFDWDTYPVNLPSIKGSSTTVEGPDGASLNIATTVIVTPIRMQSLCSLSNVESTPTSSAVGIAWNNVHKHIDDASLE